MKGNDVNVEISEWSSTQSNKGGETKVYEKVMPRVKAAYRTRYQDMSVFNMQLFHVELEERLEKKLRENERLLEFIETAKIFKRAQEEAIITATSKIRAYFKVSNFNKGGK